jgi:hypothetical protein
LATEKLEVNDDLTAVSSDDETARTGLFPLPREARLHRRNDARWEEMLMEHRFRKDQDKAQRQRKRVLAAVLGWFGTFARRPTRVSALLIVALVAAFVVASLPNAALTASPGRGSAASTITVSTSAVPASSRLTSPHYPQALNSAAAAQTRLRDVVLHLSQCLSTLSPQRQWTLILRAGIGTPQPYTRRAVARVFHIGVRHEARIERAGLHDLQAAARGGRCGSPPVLVHVPPRHRLVLSDAVLSRPPLAATTTHAAAPTHAAHRRTGTRTRLTVSRRGTARFFFTLRTGRHDRSITTITLRPPRGIAFSHSTRHLTSGIVVTRGSAKRVPLTARIRHGKLTIRLRARASRVNVRIVSPAITVSRTLARTVRAPGRHILRAQIITTTARHPVRER